MPSKILSNQRIFQTAAWMWVLYLVCLTVVDSFLYPSAPFFSPIFFYHLANFVPAIIFLGISCTPWLDKRARQVVPAILLLITATPILVNYLSNLHLPQAPLSNLEGMLLRQLPVLLIGLILVAWHYNLMIMIFYSLGTSLFEWAVVFAFGFVDKGSLSDFSFIIIIRTVSFIVVGVFINQLITRLRKQHDSLITANNQLTYYARTLEDLTISRERNRMSRELHDTVVHTLSGLSVQLETAKAYWDIDPITTRNLLEHSLEVTRSGLQETRRAIKSLRASPLDDLGLIRAMQTMIENAKERGQLIVEISFPDPDIFISLDVEQCIYRIAQEAVENVIHHAKARHMAIRLAAVENSLEFIVQDDGIGFNPESRVPAGHFGIAGMKERAHLAGGQLTVTSRPDHGTTVRLLIKGSVG
jgi:signal transduction histidine kinase